MSSRPVYRRVLRWLHLVSAYEVTAGWRLCDRLAPFVLAAYARAKPSLSLYLACVPVFLALSCVAACCMCLCGSAYDLTE